MKNADKFVVGGEVYDVLSPATFGDYMETIGSACINPDGYAENKLFLAYDDNVQKLFRATAAIAYSELLIKNTNCEPTTMAEALANALSAGGVSYDNSDSGLTASNVQDAIDEVNGDVETVNNDLTLQGNRITDVENDIDDIMHRVDVCYGFQINGSESNPSSAVTYIADA
ncbi:MAG: hypothetical protein IKE94_01260, partial [Aeriscardovia sp.]|nr:hypothetical protein [Aeriscardovia sp.]